MYKLFMLILMIPLGVQAQGFKGKRNIGLQLGVSQYDSETNASGGIFSSENFSYDISPEFAYFLSDQWRIGGGIYFGKSRKKDATQSLPDASFTNTTSVGVTLLATYHHWFSNKIAFFIEPSLSYHHSQFNTKFQGEINDKEKSHLIFLDSSIGFLFMIGKKFGVDLSTSLAKVSYFKSDRVLNESAGVKRNFNYDDLSLSVSFFGGDLQTILNNISLGIKYFF
ncbi:hypothetical protein BKI52_09480 [marine bacterium AO1-C]|nr:hypothetical protein BKI52_09480 [marine bacterium AO1-C]